MKLFSNQPRTKMTNKRGIVSWMALKKAIIGLLGYFAFCWALYAIHLKVPVVNYVLAVLMLPGYLIQLLFGSSIHQIEVESGIVISGAVLFPIFYSVFAVKERSL